MQADTRGASLDGGHREAAPRAAHPRRQQPRPPPPSHLLQLQARTPCCPNPRTVRVRPAFRKPFAPSNPRTRLRTVGSHYPALLSDSGPKQMRVLVICPRTDCGLVSTRSPLGPLSSPLSPAPAGAGGGGPITKWLPRAWLCSRPHRTDGQERLGEGWGDGTPRGVKD